MSHSIMILFVFVDNKLNEKFNNKSSLRERIILAFVLSNNKSCYHGNGRSVTQKRRAKPLKRKRQNHISKLSYHVIYSKLANSIYYCI